MGDLVSVLENYQDIELKRAFTILNLDLATTKAMGELNAVADYRDRVKETIDAAEKYAAIIRLWHT